MVIHTLIRRMLQLAKQLSIWGIPLLCLSCQDHARTDEATEIRSPCPSVRRPLVLIHGFLASGDTWSRHVQRLIQTGSCPDWIVAYDWNTLDREGDHTTQLDFIIDQLISKSGLAQVDLVGHSAGGGVSYTYLSDEQRAAKVNRYVHIGSFPLDVLPGPENGPLIPTLNIWSTQDFAVEGDNIPGATNLKLEKEDHYTVATSLTSFNAITSFLYDDPNLEEDPRTLLSSPDMLGLSGRVLSLGENQPVTESTLQIWSLDEQGIRQGSPRTTEIDQNGYFQIDNLESGHPLELVPILADEVPKVRYYTPVLRHEDPLLYLRTFPGPGSLASLLVSQLPKDSQRVSLVIFSSHRALIAGVDSLTVNGTEVLTDEAAAPENTTIALFLFDLNADGEPGGTLSLFDNFPFLGMVDLPLRAEADQSIEVILNGERVYLPAQPSEEGTMILTFP